jgi:hypothetical protein
MTIEPYSNVEAVVVRHRCLFQLINSVGVEKMGIERSDEVPVRKLRARHPDSLIRIKSTPTPLLVE